MKIIESEIIQFGKFSNRRFRFEDGMNIVRGDNESGKSTLLAFIKFALYGVGRKNPTVRVGERERAISWSTGVAAGSLTVEDENGKRYRIERAGREGARGTYVDKVRIIDLSTGEEVFANEVPGEHFLGINAQAYDSMCNIRQLECTSINGDAVKGVIDNLLSSGDENTDVQAALKTLDIERRRLLHTNGKGGLVFESELTLERLKSEHRGAIIVENENVKNADELERVEIAIKKAKDEHELAQKMCDLYDDVLRLEKFEQLRTLKARVEETNSKLSNLENSASFNTHLAGYDKISDLTSIADSLGRCKSERDAARDELDSAKAALELVTFENSDSLSEIVDEYGSEKGASAYLSAKLKKKSNSTFMLTTFSIFGAILVVFSLILAFVMKNYSGCLTVGFIGALLSALAIVFYRQFLSAKDEIATFMAKLGNGFSSADEKKIYEHLEAYVQGRILRTQHTQTLERAKERLAIAEEKFNYELQRARNMLIEMRVTFIHGEEESALLKLCASIKEYLVQKTALEGNLRESVALVNSLNAELDRFSEQSIRARITPEIEEKIRSTPHEKLKAERDLALHRLNQYSQYKAGIERSLISNGTRRSSDEIFPEIEAEQERLEALRLRLDAVRLASETISEASLNMKSDITPRIRESAEANLATLTDGKYTELYIDESMNLTYHAEGETRPIDSLSKGSLDVAYFAVRLALIKTLTSESRPPLFMDEALSQLDDSRAEKLLRVIFDHSKEAQCVLFTCQSRDVELAEKIEKINVIHLQ